MQSFWHRVFRTTSINAIVPKKCAPKTCEIDAKRWAMGLAWEKVRCWRGLILYGILPVDASSSLEPKHRRFISVNGKVGKEGRALLEGSGAKNAELLARVLHRAAVTERSLHTLHRETLTQRSLHTQRLLHRAAFTQRRFRQRSF